MILYVLLITTFSSSDNIRALQADEARLGSIRQLLLKKTQLDAARQSSHPRHATWVAQQPNIDIAERILPSGRSGDGFSAATGELSPVDAEDGKSKRYRYPRDRPIILRFRRKATSRARHQPP